VAQLRLAGPASDQETRRHICTLLPAAQKLGKVQAACTGCNYGC
jgi:hypothetical protein